MTEQEIINNENYQSLGFSEKIVQTIHDIICIEGEFLRIKNGIGFPNKIIHVRKERRYDYNKELNDIFSRFTSMVNWQQETELFQKMYQEVAEHFQFKKSFVFRDLETVLENNYIFSFYIDVKNDLVLKIQKVTLNIDSYKEMINRLNISGNNLQNLSVLILIYHNMRTTSGSNWSPFSSYSSMRYYLDGKTSSDLIPYDLKAIPNLVKVECYCSLNNNQEFLHNFPLECRCMLYSDIIQQLLTIKDTINISDPFPGGAIEYLNSVEFQTAYLMANPVYSEQELINFAIGLQNIFDTFPNKLFIVEGTLPNWKDVYERDDEFSQLLRKYNCNYVVIGNDVIMNGEHINKEIKFNYVSFQFIVNPEAKPISTRKNKPKSKLISKRLSTRE